MAVPEGPDMQPPANVRGYSLDGNQPFVISTTENDELCRSTGIEPSADGIAHPIYYYIATQIGMGVTVAQLCAACDFDVADGPMIVGSSVQFHAPLRVETPYLVAGAIQNIERRRSRKFGVIDLLEYRLALLDGDESVLVTTNRWVLPRKDIA